MTQAKSANRLERRIFTLPNLLSLLRVFLIPVFFLLITSDIFGWALLVLAISGCSDYFDGYIARKFNQVTDLGRVLDPLVDRLYIFSTLLGLSIISAIPAVFLFSVLTRDLLMFFAFIVLGKKRRSLISVRFVGKLATFCLMFTFPLFLLNLIFANNIYISSFAWTFAVCGTALYWFSAGLYIREGFFIKH